MHHREMVKEVPGSQILRSLRDEFGSLELTVPLTCAVHRQLKPQAFRGVSWVFV